MCLKNLLLDYNENSEEISKWVSLKGEIKYKEYAHFLVKNNISLTWKNLDDLFRYDKRLLSNLFTYMSTFEEFLRAKIWENTHKQFDELNDDYIGSEIKQVYKIYSNKECKEADIEFINNNYDCLRELRNAISHNKILINRKFSNMSLEETINVFCKCLPYVYQKGFTSSIKKCSNKLNLDEKIIIKI